ncbi:hypothetical protein [Kocuria massiliensis]|uniref:hypothetical protein n=1 Tax=Kocuria massiliensis TaxID=1926282 RepID=UPI000A1CA3CA|nr:hypothetical protein [Kocuria massiliensis]
MTEQRPTHPTPEPGGISWQWVPVRLDLHRQLRETSEGGVVVTGSGVDAERERILAVIREQSVPALYTVGDHNLRLMVPVHIRDEITHVARADENGELSLGGELGEFMETILAFPGLEYASWQTGDGITGAPSAVAMFEASHRQVQRAIVQSKPEGWIERASAGDRWVIVTSERYEDLLSIVDELPHRAVVLDTDGEHRAATFCPTVGDPVTLAWGPVRGAVFTYPTNSPAGALQSEIAGQEEREVRDAARTQAVKNLTEAFGLDDVGARRLSRYAADDHGRFAPESVLQLLGLTDMPAKIIDGRKAMADQPDYERVEAHGRALNLDDGRAALHAAQELGATARRSGWALAAATGVGIGAWLLRRKR